MSGAKKLLHAAAGNAGDDPVYVDDVFECRARSGTSDYQTVINNIKLHGKNYGSSYHFDTTDDYIERSSDFSSNTDGKTFTLSAWVWWAWVGNSIPIYGFGSSDSRFVLNSGNFEVVLYNDSTKVIDQNITYNFNPHRNSWVHILISLNVNTGAGKLYVNDSAVSWTPSIMNNLNITFTGGTHQINRIGSDFTGPGECKLSDVYLDYTYRDLATTANRRLFIDANGGAADGLASLNPIMYLPFSSDYAVTKNLGTGGDFTSTNGDPTLDKNYGPYYDEDSAKGGAIWTKDRGGSRESLIWDTTKGVEAFPMTGDCLRPHTTNGTLGAEFIRDVYHNGYLLWDGYYSNTTGRNYADWTFRKQEKFFDIVTWTGNGSNRTISHNLGSVPGCIMVKRYSSTKAWAVYHRGCNNGTNPETKYLVLDTDAAEVDDDTMWNDTAPTADVFTVGTHQSVNTADETYVAYLYAHDEENFGEDSDESIIKCGYVSASSSYIKVDLGWQPQWLMIKRHDGSGAWDVVDKAREFNDREGDAAVLDINDADVETTAGIIRLDDKFASDGEPTGWHSEAHTSGSYIYMAIRDTMHKPVTSDSDPKYYFDVAKASDSSGAPQYVTDYGWSPDIAIERNVGSSQNTKLHTRAEQQKEMWFNSTQTETNIGAISNASFDYQNGYHDGTGTSDDDYAFMWKRAKGFADVVYYRGDGGAWGQNIRHNLGVTPELIIVRAAGSNSEYWQVDAPVTSYERGGWPTVAFTNAGQDYFGTHTATTFAVGVSTDPVNGSNVPYIALLFASVDGISKIGTYSGTGSAQNIDCGFDGNARFVLIKGVNVASETVVHTTDSGIAAGDNSYFKFDSNGANGSGDRLDPYTGGFALGDGDTDTNNASYTYLYYAIA